MVALPQQSFELGARNLGTIHLEVGGLVSPHQQNLAQLGVTNHEGIQQKSQDFEQDTCRPRKSNEPNQSKSHNFLGSCCLLTTLLQATSWGGSLWAISINHRLVLHLTRRKESSVYPIFNTTFQSTQQNHHWWVDLSICVRIRWNYGKSSNIRHHRLGQWATEVFSKWGDGPIKTAMEFGDVWSWTWRQIFLCHHKLVRHNWWIDGLPCAFSFSFIVLFRTRILTISVHQRPAVASCTKVVVCQKGLFGTPQSWTWELRLILIFLMIADLPFFKFLV